MKKAGRLLLVLLLLSGLSACDTWDDWFDDDDDDDTTDISTTTTDTTTTTTTAKSDTSDNADLKYSHYNPAAWHGAGSAIVLCSNSPKMIACEIEGQNLVQHGSYDKGRQVFTSYYDRGLSGTITCSTGSASYSTDVSGGGLQFGSCR